MGKVDELKATYSAMVESMPDSMKQLFQGVLMGIDLAAGAAAQDYAEELKVRNKELEERLIASATGRESWRRDPVAGGTGTRTRDQDKLTKVYAFVDPRDEKPFYVGSAIDPASQLRDYIRSDDEQVATCKPRIDEIVAAGAEVQIHELEGVRVGDANSAKARWMAHYEGEGATLLNQRRG